MDKIPGLKIYLFPIHTDLRTGKLISRDYQIRSTETVQFFDYLCINFDIFVFCKQQGKCAELVYCQNLRGNEKWIFLIIDSFINFSNINNTVCHKSLESE